MFEFIMTHNCSELARYSYSSTSIACKHACNEILDGALLFLYTHAHFISKELTHERDSAAAILGVNTSNTSSSRRENKRSGRQGDAAVTTLLLGQKVRQRVPCCKSLYFIMNIFQSFWLHSINLFMQLMLAIVIHVTIRNILDNEFLVIICGNFLTYIFLSFVYTSVYVRPHHYFSSSVCHHYYETEVNVISCFIICLSLHTMNKRSPMLCLILCKDNLHICQYI
jgi:hypothetical protein